MIISYFRFYEMSRIVGILYPHLSPISTYFEVYQEPELITFRYTGPGFLGKTLGRPGLTADIVHYLMLKKL